MLTSSIHRNTIHRHACQALPVSSLEKDRQALKFLILGIEEWEELG